MPFSLRTVLKLLEAVVIPYFTPSCLLFYYKITIIYITYISSFASVRITMAAKGLCHKNICDFEVISEMAYFVLLFKRTTHELCSLKLGNTLNPWFLTQNPVWNCYSMCILVVSHISRWLKIHVIPCSFKKCESTEINLNYYCSVLSQEFENISKLSYNRSFKLGDKILSSNLLLSVSSRMTVFFNLICRMTSFVCAIQDCYKSPLKKLFYDVTKQW